MHYVLPVVYRNCSRSKARNQAWGRSFVDLPKLWFLRFVGEADLKKGIPFCSTPINLFTWNLVALVKGKRMDNSEGNQPQHMQQTSLDLVKDMGAFLPSGHNHSRGHVRKSQGMYFIVHGSRFE